MHESNFGIMLKDSTDARRASLPNQANTRISTHSAVCSVRLRHNASTFGQCRTSGLSLGVHGSQEHIEDPTGLDTQCH